MAWGWHSSGGSGSCAGASATPPAVTGRRGAGRTRWRSSGAGLPALGLLSPHLLNQLVGVCGSVLFFFPPGLSCLPSTFLSQCGNHRDVVHAQLGVCKCPMSLNLNKGGFYEVQVGSPFALEGGFRFPPHLCQGGSGRTLGGVEDPRGKKFFPLGFAPNFFGIFDRILPKTCF